MGGSPEFGTEIPGLPVEGSPNTMVTGNRLPQVIFPVGIFGLVGLLPLISGAGKVMVQPAGDQFISNDGLYSRKSDKYLPFFVFVISYFKKDPGRYLRLVNSTHRTRLVGKPAFNKSELGGIHRGKLHHAHVDIAVFMDQFRSQ